MKLLVKVSKEINQNKIETLNQKISNSKLWRGITSKPDQLRMFYYIEIEFVEIDESNLKEFTSILGLIVQVGTII